MVTDSARTALRSPSGKLFVCVNVQGVDSNFHAQVKLISLCLPAYSDAGQRCPVDNEMLSKEQLFPDNFAKREILSLMVRCSNPGCTSKMELRHLEVRNLSTRI